MKKHVGKLLLTTLAIGTWWLAFIEEPELNNAESTKAHKIDYYLKQFTVLSLDTKGQPEQTLHAEYLEHYPDDDSTEITLPNITMHTYNKPDIHIKSDTGFISADGELVLLNGAVNIHRKSSSADPDMNIDTQNLRVQIENNYAETDEFVHIVSGQNSVSGTGLKAYFREPLNVNVLANVKGHHEIN